jgi:hypothetical protein
MLLHGDGSAGPVAATGVGAGVSTTVTNFNADASTNNFNVTINGDAKSNNFTPYQSGYYSNFFDGTSGQYLNAPANTVFNFGTGDFTVEAWVYPTSTSGTRPIIEVRTTGGANGFALLSQSGATTLNVYTNSSFVGVSTNSLTTNAWNHVALTRSTNTWTYWINGVSGGSFTNSSTQSDGATTGPKIGGSTTSGEIWVGYISNARITKGGALYTTTFTPSTTPSTTTVSSGTVSLLTCQSNRFIDNSVNAFTITVNGTPQVSPAQPFTLPTTVATYGSGYFDGTGDYLTAPSNSAFAFGTGDFTVECWAYFTSVANFPTLTDSRATTSSTAGFNLGLSTAKVQLYTTSQLLIGSTTLVANTWYHIAVTRSGTTLKIWLNGVQDATVSNSTNWSDTTLLLGSTPTPTNYMTGYMTDTRLVKGTAVYSATFTPPTTPLTAITNTSLLTTQYNGGGNNSGFKDSSQFNFPITRNGNTTQGTFTPYGSNWSNYFNGSDAYWKQASSTNYILGTNDFTLECWINVNSTSVTMRRLFGVGYGANGGSHGCSWEIQYTGSESPTGQINVNRYDGSTSTSYATSGATIVAGQWHHIAVSRTGGNLRIFVDGVAYYNAANTFNFTQVTYGGNTELWTGLGYYGPAGGLGGPRYFGGYMSNIRIINGTGIYSSNFTPSTTPLTAVTNTQLLSAQSNRFVDNSTNAQAITTGGSPSVQRFSPFAPLTVYNPTTYGGSAYFDGTGDYLTAPNDASFDMANGDFTVELWFNPTQAKNTSLFTKRASNASYSPIMVQWTSGSQLTAFCSTSGSSWGMASTTSATYPLNSWIHVAFVRFSNNLYLYVNGVSAVTPVAISAAVMTNTSAFVVGADDAAGNLGYAGYISNCRVVKGTAVYTAAFTPPTAPLTAITNTSLLLNLTNAGILDNAMMNDLETVGNAQISTSVKKYGTGSMYFDGTGDNLSALPSAGALGSGDWTVEFWWQWISATGDYQTVVSKGIVGGTPANGSWSFGPYQQANNIWFAYYNSGFTDVSAVATLNDGAWHHMAASRQGTSLRLFADGVLKVTATLPSNLDFGPSTTDTFLVG